MAAESHGKQLTGKASLNLQMPRLTSQGLLKYFRETPSKEIHIVSEGPVELFKISI